MTLGQLLKSKRLELGKSVEQIATATRIHTKVLRALEDDRYGELPARAFTRGFIITYCKALQLDPDKIIRDYHDFLESKFAERPEKDHGHQGYAFEGKETEQNKRWMIISASGAAFFAVLTLLFFKPQNHKHKEKHKELIAEEAEIAANSMPPSPLIPDVVLAANSSAPTTATTTTTSTITTISATSSTSPSVAPTAVVTLPSVAAIKPMATTTPTQTPVAVSTPAPKATPSPSPSPVAEATPKDDQLNKGDSLAPKEVGVKVVFLAVEDTLIRYRSDQRKPFSIMLRKDKQLVIKATDSIKFNTQTPENLKYRLTFKNKPTSGYSELKEQGLEIHPDGSQNPIGSDSF